jgi:hypothetical protein
MNPFNYDVNYNVNYNKTQPRQETSQQMGGIIILYYGYINDTTKNYRTNS